MKQRLIYNQKIEEYLLHKPIEVIHHKPHPKPKHKLRPALSKSSSSKSVKSNEEPKSDSEQKDHKLTGDHRAEENFEQPAISGLVMQSGQGHAYGQSQNYPNPNAAYSTYPYNPNQHGQFAYGNVFLVN